jgi:mono/diheme cytochrome c family protein
MFAYELEDGELGDLVLFVLSLYQPDFPAQYLDLNLINELKKARKSLNEDEIYLRFCSACHGPEGKGGENVQLGVRFPMLSNPDFQAVVSRKFLEYTVRYGRETRMMTSWQTGYGGLDEPEIKGIVGRIRQYRPEPVDPGAVLDLHGASEQGEIVYSSFCACCHGDGGEGGLGPSLNNPDFLKLADTRYLFGTIVTGRSDTAMPAWARLSVREITNLLAYLESWRSGDLVKLAGSVPLGDVEEGEALFSQYCGRCHGDAGQGGVAPAILNPDFLKVAGDSFLLGNISSGRNHTGMLGWRSEQTNDGKLAPTELGDLLAYFRSNPQEGEPEIIHQQSLGDARSGGRVYVANCAECHGSGGQGGLGPALINQFFLKGATNGYLTATVVLGRATTPMPSWAREGRNGQVLTSRQILDVVSYLRSWHRREIKWDVPVENEEKDYPVDGN